MLYTQLNSLRKPESWPCTVPNLATEIRDQSWKEESKMTYKVLHSIRDDLMLLSQIVYSIFSILFDSVARSDWGSRRVYCHMQ